MIPSCRGHSQTISFLLLSFLFGNTGLVQARQAAFIYPPNNDTTYIFNSVDTINASWTSTNEKPDLKLWCKTPDQNNFRQAFTLNVNATGSSPVLLNIGNAGTCHLSLSDLAHPVRGLKSSDFDVQVQSNAEPTTYGANSPPAPTTSIDSSATAASTASGTISTSAVTATSATAAPSAKATEVAGKTSGLSTGQGVGIGVGVAAGCVLIVTGAILLFLRFRHHRHLADNTDRLEKPLFLKNISKPPNFRRLHGLNEAGGGVSTPRVVRAPAGLHEAQGTMASQELASPDDMLSARSELSIGGPPSAGRGEGMVSELDSMPIK